MTVPFFPGFTAITGPNGSGKSNIADLYSALKAQKLCGREDLPTLFSMGERNTKILQNTVKYH